MHMAVRGFHNTQVLLWQDVRDIAHHSEPVYVAISISAEQTEPGVDSVSGRHWKSRTTGSRDNTVGALTQDLFSYLLEQKISLFGSRFN